ncbi:MAG TPA: tetratricopeptide repeat protein [Methylomirabilota bacterium]|nr:tetratricopeptide repeat protein [Methylomirabilota bacterium]
MPVDDATTANAIRRQEERLQRDPTSLAFAQLADLYRKIGRTREAIALCREGLERYPHYTTARLILAKALLAEDEFDQALAELSAILSVSPNDLQCHRLAAEIHRRQGRLDVAVDHLEAAVRLDAGDRESRALLGLLRAGTPAGSEAGGLSRVLADDTFVTTSFGRVCLEQSLADEAAQVFGRILRREPGNSEARQGLEQALRLRFRRKG